MKQNKNRGYLGTEYLKYGFNAPNTYNEIGIGNTRHRNLDSINTIKEIKFLTYTR